MRTTRKTRLLALFLAVVMVIGYIPTYAFATETEETQETTAAFVEETEAVTEAAEETEPAETTAPSQETEQATEAATEAATEEATEAATEETTEETTQPEEEYDFPDPSVMTDAELLAYYDSLDDDQADAFAASLTQKQLDRLMELLQDVANCGEASETHTVFKNTQSTLAPGVTQNLKFAYAADGKQMAYYIATADVTRDDVVVQTSYYKQHEGGVMGMAKLTEQIAYANAKYTNPEDANYISDYYNVVAGVNASFYNMTTGQPLGITFIDGVSFGTGDYNNFFAILKDGKTAVIDYASNLGKYVDKNGESTIWQAAAGSQWLVRDGKNVTAGVTGSYNTDRHSRTCVGVTADGKVVLMVLDGRQEPFSCGGSMHELAQIMLEAGCVAAVNLDGGGSTTFASKAEGANAVSVINRPSDGSERSISAGIIIASTTVPSNVFDHVTMVAADEYVTPGTSTKITVSGVSPAGTTAEIPADVTYTVTNGTYENGVLTAGEAGDVVLTAMQGDKTVGSLTIHCVIPEKITFANTTITVPYGKTVQLEVVATYGLNTVTTKADDLTFTLSDSAMGTVDGLSFTACGEDAALTGGTITATLTQNTQVTCTANVIFGKGSQVLADFEDQDLGDMYIITGYPQYGPSGANGQNELGKIYIVDAQSGQVHNGDYALAVECDYSQAYETGYHLLNLNGLKLTVPANAQTIGMWLYVPELEELYGTSMRLNGTTAEGSSVSSPWLWDNCAPYAWTNDGWRYVTMDISSYDSEITFHAMQFYICDRDNSDVGYYFKDHASVNGKFTYYIDNITVDFSSAVDDREAPVFSSVVYANEAMSDAASLNGQTSTLNVLSFTASVADYSADNATGVASVGAYIDGVAVPYTYAGGKIIIADMTLADGVHTIRFEATDNMGNKSYVERQITVSANSNIPTVSIVPEDPDADKLLIGSLYWVDLVATSAKDVQSVSVNLNLNSVSQWELSHMEVTSGFKATYTLDQVTNNATITVTKVGNVAEDATVLVRLPIRTWESRLTSYPGYEDQTPAKLWTRKIIWPMDIKLSAKRGVVTFTDGTTGSFSMEKLSVLTELYGNYAKLNANGDYSNKSSWHIHSATALADKAATCTESGYTGRTYCEVCHSVVTWGTTIPATGHTYELTDGVLKCHCGVTFTGTWTDGREYVDGVAQADGWVGDSYYVDGAKLTGVQLVDGYYYDFGEDGTCVGKIKYTGFLEKDDGWYYITIGTEAKGWQYIDGKYYYFDPNTGLSWYGKTYYVYDETYQFNEKGMVLDGIWHYDGVGTLYYYGPGAYKRAWVEIDGNTYYFDEQGHRKEGISWFYLGQSNNPPTWYEFTEEGVYVRTFNETGLWEYNGKLYYLNEGVNQKGLFLVDGDYYYFNSTDFTAVSGRYYVNTTNGLDIAPGYYNFDESTHKMVVETDDKPGVKNGLVEENGGLYYYVNGVLTYAGLIQVDGDYYYINSSCKAVTGTYWVFKTNGLLPEGSYEFGTDGKMIIASDGDDEVKNGLVEENGGLYYYVDGVLTYAGLIQVDGDYYYINSSCKAVTGTYWVFKTNDLLPAGSYEFAADGKMILASDGDDEAKNGLVEENGGLYYYVDGVLTYAGLIQVDGDYYYINSSCKAVTGTYWVFKTNDLLPAGSYEFGTDGKMIIASDGDDEVKDGLIEENGGLYYYVDGVLTYAGLIQVDDDYYYINSSCKAVTGTYWVFKTNGLLPAGYYTFGTDGKMIAQ